MRNVQSSSESRLALNAIGFFFHCRAKRATKYMNPTLNVHTIIPCSFIHCRVKRVGSFGECLKVALHSVVAPWIFRKRKGFCSLHGLSKTNLVKTAFLSILAAVVVGSDLRNSANQSAQPTETEGRNRAIFFLSKCSLP